MSGTLAVITVRPGELHLAAELGLGLLAIADLPFVVIKRRLYRPFTVRMPPLSGTPDYIALARIVPIVLCVELAKLAIWQRLTPSGREVRIFPPKAVARIILANPENWPASWPEAEA